MRSALKAQGVPACSKTLPIEPVPISRNGALNPTAACWRSANEDDVDIADFVLNSLFSHAAGASFACRSRTPSSRRFVSNAERSDPPTVEVESRERWSWAAIVNRSEYWDRSGLANDGAGEGDRPENSRLSLEGPEVKVKLLQAWMWWVEESTLAGIGSVEAYGCVTDDATIRSLSLH